MANLEVIDADGHITESDAQLKKYMPEKYVKRVSSLTPGDSWDRSLSGKLGTRAGMPRVGLTLWTAARFPPRCSIRPMV